MSGNPLESEAGAMGEDPSTRDPMGCLGETAAWMRGAGALVASSTVLDVFSLVKPTRGRNPEPLSKKFLES
jgi:hypothetical protein